jgi:glycosyltransferase involved in cell wall biosynthesis
MTVGIVVATYGDVEWIDKAHNAFDSAICQTVPADMVIHAHGETLAMARNAGARAMDTEWLIFVDADDRLNSTYVEAMLAGDGDLRQPSTLGVYPDGHTDAEAVLIPAKPLIDGNYLVIGTMVRRTLFERAGGFVEWPMYEDWDLWIRCVLLDGTVGACPDAVYQVMVNEVSRNNQPRQEQINTYNAIRSAHLAHWKRR